MKLGIYFLVILGLFSCSQVAIETALKKHSWTVEEVHYKDSVYGLFFFRMNSMKFNEGNSCELPYFNWARYFNSKWEVSNIRSKSFELTLLNSDQNFLDGTYISRIYYDDSLKLRVLILESERLKLVCKSQP